MAPSDKKPGEVDVLTSPSSNTSISLGSKETLVASSRQSFDNEALKSSQEKETAIDTIIPGQDNHTKTSVDGTLDANQEKHASAIDSSPDDSNNNDDQARNTHGTTLNNFRDNQNRVLTTKELLIAFPALAFVLLISFLDQTSIGTALPAIAGSLNTGSSISWISTSFLASSTAIQLINGRMSDIFGRKACLMTALGIMAIGNVLCGFSKTPAQLYGFRGLAGVGAGALNALVQITISDITTLEQRGHFFGIIGIFVALGNGLGPIVGGLLTEKAGWRWAFWFISPMAVASIVILSIVLPGVEKDKRESMLTKLRMVDWFGFVLNIGATLLILIPVSEGGFSFAFDSAAFISMITVGFVLAIAFVIVEWKFAKIPVVPIRLFKMGRTANNLLGQNLFIGWVYWANLFYLPIYYQNVHGYSPSKAGLLIIPMVIAHGICSGVSGSLISWTGHYHLCIIGGAVSWTVGLACQAAFYTPTTRVWVFIVIGIAQGIGVGFCFQPVLVALLANSIKKDRAVMTGLRNFIRAMGGAIGITISTAILNNILVSGLKDSVSTDIIGQITSSIHSLDSLGLTAEQQTLVRDKYMYGLHIIFITFAAMIGFCLVCTMFIRDRGLKPLDEQPHWQARMAERQRKIDAKKNAEP